MPNLGEALGRLGVAFNPDDVSAAMESLVTEWRDFFKTTATIDTSPEQISALGTMMSAFLNAPTRQQELEFIAQAAADPLSGLTLALAALPGTATRQVERFWNLLFGEQLLGGFSIADWNIRELPAPYQGPDDASSLKYLIVSDLHRDAASDDLGPLAAGSIDHFKFNSDLFQRIIDFADRKNYILIEGGDCEELWFIRDAAAYPKKLDGALDVAQKLREIITTHGTGNDAEPGIYEKLRKLHREGRYYRIYGNHDSFLKPDENSDDSVFAVLRDEMQQGGAPPFQIYDAFVIPGLKSMLEKAPFEIALDALHLATGELTANDFVTNLVKGRLGLDSNDYAVDTRMLITHGHQFDFWNCPENEILGLLIANSVGMFVDRRMDPFLDLRGIASQGNPWIDFADVFSGWPIFNSWVSHDPSVRFAHDVQHMANGDRQLSDTVLYFESVAALVGTLGIALNFVDPDTGTIVTPAMSRGKTDAPGDAAWRLDLMTPTGMATYLSRHHLHHICIGHTHNPHSQPFATLSDLQTLVPPLAPLIALIRLLLPNLLEPTLKTTYFNSGTGGWMEGVIWAIEIDGSGQARLVYWTDNSIGPEYMDWELQPLDASVKAQLEQGLRNALDDTAAALTTDLEELRAMLDARLQQLAVAGADISAALGAVVALPFYCLAAALQSGAQQIKERLRQLQEVPKAIEQKLEDFEKQFGQLREFQYDTILSAKRHSFAGYGSATEDPETLIIKAPIAASERERLERVQRVLVQMGASQDQALHYAGVAVAAFGEFPLNMPFFSNLLQPLNPMGLLQASESPVLHGLLSTLWMYPAAGQVVDIRGVKITSNFELLDGEVSLTVRIEQGQSGDGGPVIS